MRIVFLGTPDFAVPSLKAIHSAGYDIVGVVTQPDKPKGRKSKLVPCDTKVAALELGLPVFQFDRIRNKSARDVLIDLNPDLFVTAAYGQILSQRVLDIPKLGCVNVHGSLLPKYRGAAPIQWCVINGEKKTGVTTMLTALGVDTGDMLLKTETDINPSETAGELFDRLSLIGAELIVKTIKAIEDGSVTPIKQNEEEATHFPMLKKEDGSIDWNNSALDIHNLVRGVNPWPGAFTLYNDKLFKIWAGECVEGKTDKAPGTVASLNDGLDIATGDGIYRIIQMQVPGKKRTFANAWLNGAPIKVGDMFNND